MKKINGVAEAIELQKAELEKWKKVLKPIYFLTLRDWAERNNNDPTATMHDIPFGTGLEAKVKRMRNDEQD